MVIPHSCAAFLLVSHISHSCFWLYVDPEGKYEALEKYGNDMTELARRGKLDPVIGRDDEIRRCIQILSRRTKNNPVIIGEPGVGKTAIAEGYEFFFFFKCCVFYGKFGQVQESCALGGLKYICKYLLLSDS